MSQTAIKYLIVVLGTKKWLHKYKLINTRYPLAWTTEWGQFTLGNWIKGSVWHSENVTENDRYLKKTGEYNCWNVLTITTKNEKETVKKLNHFFYHCHKF